MGMPGNPGSMPSDIPPGETEYLDLSPELPPVLGIRPIVWRIRVPLQHHIRQ